MMIGNAMNPDIDLTVRGFSVKTAYYLVKVCALAYNTPLGAGIGELGLVDAMAVPFDFGELHGFVATLDSYVVLGFRGTDSIATWMADGRIVQAARPPYPGMVHRGFADALDAIWNQLKTRLPQALGKRPLYVTGHSLGGALASLAAYRLAAEGIPIRAAYTFGSPRVGNLDFYSGYNVVNYRFVHNNDLVPHVPLEFLLVGVPLADRALFGHPVQGLLHFVYKHVGTEVSGSQRPAGRGHERLGPEERVSRQRAHPRPGHVRAGGDRRSPYPELRRRRRSGAAEHHADPSAGRGRRIRTNTGSSRSRGTSAGRAGFAGGVSA
jgi:hypothetical protein